MYNKLVDQTYTLTALTKKKVGVVVRTQRKRRYGLLTSCFMKNEGSY